MDVTLIKLLDGTRLFLHAVIDNYSRKLLAWQLSTKLEPTTTCRVLEAAGEHLPGTFPTVVADSGVENVNHEVDRLLDLGRLRRVLAQVEVLYSNSMIEAWWRSLKQSWLYLHTLDSRAAVERLVAFYVEQHNRVIPHLACDGRTPDEVYFGTANNLADELAAGRRQARAGRLVSNRAIACSECASQGPPAEIVPRDAARFLRDAVAPESVREVVSRSRAAELLPAGGRMRRRREFPDTTAAIRKGVRAPASLK
jgi:hypothetical protein